MNEFERKLSRMPFRPPPETLREAIFADGDAKIAAPKIACWTWRDWFWPAPQAWATLAALWIVFAALSTNGRSGPTAIPLSQVPPGPVGGKLISYLSPTALHDVLELAN